MYTQHVAYPIKHKGDESVKVKVRWKKYLLLILGGGMIPITLILSYYFEWPERATIPLIVVLSIIFAAMALWAYANREADGSEWWQDDNASGWRGY